MRDLRERLQELYEKTKIVGLPAGEAKRLSEFLGDADLKFRFFVGDLIRRNANGSVGPLMEVVRTGSDETRRSAVHLLGKIGRGLPGDRQPEIVNVIIPALRDDDPKVRRNAAIALGDLKSTVGLPAIVDALSGEPFEWVRPSMILAMGQIGGPESAAALANIAAGTPADMEALAKAQDRTNVSDEGSAAPMLRFPEERTIELRSAPGLENILCGELVAHVSGKPTVVQTGAVAVTIQDLRPLAQIRTYREWLIPMGTRDLQDKSDGSVRSAGHDLLQRGLAELIPLCEGSSPRVRYRIEVRGRETTHDSRRRLIAQWVKDLDKSFPETTNSPSHYGVELRLQRAKTQVSLFAKVMAGQEERFKYRVADVPAAMHPATAAGVVQMARKKSGQSRVLDPFCGSGTMLFERALSGRPFAELVGSDISGNAIDAARSNLSEFGQGDVVFHRGDVKLIALKSRFDELISNLPYGIRTGSHDKNIDVYHVLFERLSEWMNDGASITIVTQELDLTKQLFQSSKHLHLSHTHRIDTGGLQPAVFVGTFSS
jgi:23S rRNA G2445 N2-methylase RlmL